MSTVIKNTIVILFALMSASNANADYIRQLTCLADNVYFEARGESRSGWSAVTNVVFNRLDSKHFPKTPCQVIKQRRGHVCQFSWVCERADRTYNYRKTKLYRAIRTHVHQMYKDRSRVVDNTNGALFYHSTKINHSELGLLKNVIQTAKIGNHIFYTVSD